MTSEPTTYAGCRFPAEIISYAVWLYHVFGLSLREVELILAAWGIVVSHESIRQWCLTFGREFARKVRQRRPKPGDTWHLDEVFLKIGGKLQYLWRAVDQRGMVLDILVQDRRNATAAKRFFKRLLAGLKYKPRRIVTDGLRSYGVARREILPGVRHRTSRYLNNRAENLYGTFCVKRSLLSSPDRVLPRRIRQSLAAEGLRGARLARDGSRHELVFGRSKWARTMMQPCASAAKLRGGGPSLTHGIEAIILVGRPPPRTLIGSPRHHSERRSCSPAPIRPPSPPGAGQCRLAAPRSWRTATRPAAASSLVPR
jgi:putative transposase